MRGSDDQPDHLFSYISLEQRIPANHPLRPIREMTSEALRAISRELDAVYSDIGRVAIGNSVGPVLLCLIAPTQTSAEEQIEYANPTT